ncbi:MAG: ribokinase [Lachnospiraceae bacterium]
MKIYNFGSLNVDRVYGVEDFVRAGETILAKSLSFFPGGKGLNQTIALARAGANVYHVGCIGRDGGILKDTLVENQVPLTYVKEMDADGGHTALQVSESGQNAIIVYSGTNHMLTENFVDEVMQTIEPGDYVLMQNEINLVPYIIRKAKEAGAQVALNPSPITKELMSYPLEMVDLFIVNEIEGEAVTGEKEPQKILAAFREKYPHAKIVLTLGSEGSCYQDETTFAMQEIYKNTVVDTTGAGDTYCGYLLTCLMEGVPVKEALHMATAASSIAVSRQGAAPSIPKREEVEAFLKERNKG